MSTKLDTAFASTAETAYGQMGGLNCPNHLGFLYGVAPY